MSHLKQGDRVWIAEDPYDDTAPIGFATVTRASSDGCLIEVLNSYATERRSHLAHHGMPWRLATDCCVCRQPLTAEGTCVNHRCVASESQR